MPSNAPEGLETALALGLAVKLAEWDIATYVTSGIYATGAVRPVYFGPNEPPNAPDERLLLTPRPAIDVPGSRRTVDVPIGFNWRGEVDGDPLAGIDMLALIRRRLERLGPPVMLGTVPASGVRHQSSGMIGSDTNRRPGATANYLFRCRMALVNA